MSRPLIDVTLLSSHNFIRAETTCNEEMSQSSHNNKDCGMVGSVILFAFAR
jgi:hypothetical protein